MSTEQPQAERGATLTHAVPHPATKGPGLLQPGPRGQVEGASHARGPDSAGRWSALPVGNSELPPAAAAGGKTESPPPGPGVPAALPAAAAPRPPSSWSGCQLPTQQPSGPARHRQGRREEEGGAGAHFAGTGEKGRAGPQTAEGLQGCGRGRPGQKGPRDLAVGCVSADWSVLAERRPSAFISLWETLSSANRSWRPPHYPKTSQSLPDGRPRCGPHGSNPGQARTRLLLGTWDLTSVHTANPVPCGPRPRPLFLPEVSAGVLAPARQHWSP